MLGWFSGVESRCHQHETAPVLFVALRSSAILQPPKATFHSGEEDRWCLLRTVSDGEMWVRFRGSRGVAFGRVSRRFEVYQHFVLTIPAISTRQRRSSSPPLRSSAIFQPLKLISTRGGEDRGCLLRIAFSGEMWGRDTGF